MKRYIFSLLICSFVIHLVSCKKFLDEKSDNNLVEVSTLKDLQAILDYYARVNQFSLSSGDASCDDYYLNTTEYKAIPDNARRIYTWEKDYLIKPFPNEWGYAYDNIYRANTILAELQSIERTEMNAPDWDNIKGQALALRGRSLLALSFSYCLAYDQSTASTDLGLPLRLDPDFNTQSVRASVEDTYRQIISDLEAAYPLLPVIPKHVMRMSRPAAFAFLARTNIAMRKYQKAGMYADSCLKLYSTLLDYNNVNAAAAFPFGQFNSEVIFHSNAQLPENLYNTNRRIDSLLYASYTDNDLRKTLFYTNISGNLFAFKGSYHGLEASFDGVATDEIYLIRAESFARAGNKDAALADLNTLLVKRWKKNTFVAITSNDAAGALSIILKERRKELVFRCLRWMDIKRLNKEGANINLQRFVDGKEYKLTPNHIRYALPIPEDVIAVSGMQQNPR